MKNPSYPSSSIAGFSLVELSIVLIIIGLLVGGSITATNSQMAAAKKTQTLAKMDTLEQAITAFLALNGRLPCPGNLTLAPSDPNFGLEYCTGTTSKDMQSVLPPNFSQVVTPDSWLDTWIISGSVPVRTLQLPDEFMVDGWDNRFTFVITEGFGGWGAHVYGTPGHPHYFGNTSTGLITIKDAAGGIRTNQAAYVFLSHGANGFGAWLHDGNGQRPASPNADELENGPLLSSGLNETFVQKEANSQFDDIVRYKMKWQLVREAGAIISTPECSSANDILNQVVSCNSTSAMPDCNAYLLSFANQVNNWCIQQ